MRFGLLGKLIRRARKLNHVVAAGPKTPGRAYLLAGCIPTSGGRAIGDGRSGSPRTSTVERHPARPCEVVFIKPHLLHALLSHDISRSKQDLAREVSELQTAASRRAHYTDSGSNALGQQRALRQPHLVPVAYTESVTPLNTQLNHYHLGITHHRSNDMLSAVQNMYRC